MEICIPEVVAVGHKCTYEGHYPEDSKVQKIQDWPDCTSLTEVRGFLGVCGIIQIWVKDFAKRARPLVVLTRKDAEFVWGPEQKASMEDLKLAVVSAPCLQPINYHCDRWVILAVDSSCIATGFILLQLGADGKHYPSRFGSINWNERESHYSQAKIEIYGLWRALQAYRLYIIGVKNLHIEIDASYIKGMLNNPDIQPGAAVNRWIVGIKLFHFDLVHVPGTLHNAPDGLSRHAHSPNDPDDEEDPDDWLDRTMGFAVVLINSAMPWSRRLQLSSPVGFPLASSLLSASFSACSGYLYADSPPAGPSPEIPRSTHAQLADDRLDTIQSILSDPLASVNLPLGTLRKLIHHASKFFILDGRLMRRDVQGRHKVVVSKDSRFSIISRAHEAVGHRALFSTLASLREHFWWPMLVEDVKWFISTCHPCQTRQLQHLHIPLVIPDIPSLFRKVHIDTVLMPTVNKFRYLVQAHCGLSSWPEWWPLQKENEKTFIFEEILCRCGGVAEIVTDNGPAFMAAAGYLSEKYGIHHIKISPYNSQANGLVE